MNLSDYVSRITDAQLLKEIRLKERSLAHWQTADKRQKRVKQEILWLNSTLTLYRQEAKERGLYD